MNANQLVRDFYVITDLRVTDDSECTRGFSLQQVLLAERDDEKFGAAVLHDRKKEIVLEWAKKSFSSRTDFYVCVLEQRSNGNQETKELVYVSPALNGKIASPNSHLNIEAHISHYQKALKRIIDTENQEKQLEERKRKRKE
jgi:hypothetical protein